MKAYRDLAVVPLPRDLPDQGVPATAALAGGPVTARPLDAAQLGRILFLGAGVVRVTERDGQLIPFRASGSAGGRFPLEVYASTCGVAGVPDGVHWYNPREHALLQVAPAASGTTTTLVVTGVPWRTGWRYAERGWRHLRAALRGIDVPHWVVVHGVDGIRPGVYRWPDLDHPVRSGDLRDETQRVRLDQALAGDTAYVVVAAAPVAALDDRGYREAQLAAGLVEGRLHLAAYALGASASGMTFADAAVPALLGAADDLATLLFTCVGVPAYVARRGGAPGAPSTFRPVQPRIVPQT